MVLEHLIEDVVKDSSSESSNDTELISKWNAKAFIWKYFGFEPNEKGNPQSNTTQNSAFVAAKDGNTSNLYSHLKNKWLYKFVPFKSSWQQQ